MNHTKNTGRKFLITLMNFRKTAYHHYGNKLSSILKFIYYSVFGVNTFVVVGIGLNVETELPHYPLDPEFKVLKPSLEELNKLRAGENLPREFFYDRIHGVRRCYLALCRDEIAYIHWVYLKGDYNRFLKLSDHVAELNYNTALPKFRGRRLQTKMLGHILRDLQKEGFKMVVGVVNKNNPASLKGAKRAGFKELGRIKAIGPFNRKISL